MSNVLSALTRAVRDAAVVNPNFQVEPVCILWSDRDCYGEAIIQHIQTVNDAKDTR